MIFTTRKGQSFDTETDLTAAERHIVQKLMAWKSVSVSIDVFREKKRQALQAGWNNSGPVRESLALAAIIRDLEQDVIERGPM